MRTCGDCTVCCTLCHVPELGKVEGVTCEHCDKGCRIYEGRPETCASYECEWKKGVLPEGLRPDLCGVMLEVYPKMVAALLLPGRQLADLEAGIRTQFDCYVDLGLPVIATGQFAKLPAGMTATEAKDRLIATVREYRGA